MTKEYSVVSSHPEDLEPDGRVYAPGAKVTLTEEEASHPFNARKIREGILVPRDGEDNVLRGEELHERAKELDIPIGGKSADELREAVANAEADAEADNDQEGEGE